MEVSDAKNLFGFNGCRLRLDSSSKQPIIVTRPKTETFAFPLEVGQIVTVGLVRFRVLPNYTLASERASRILDTK